ncbi:MAG: hypothetical protein JOY96_02575 [Verrucomicrobia bacterium]|nr:hypothetical protein [Verrucomicrobiota bacterium]MBV9671490.1 hypothetical protein [Verrucomicrobiota bacterium]
MIFIEKNPEPIFFLLAVRKRRIHKSRMKLYLLMLPVLAAFFLSGIDAVARGGGGHESGEHGQSQQEHGQSRQGNTQRDRRDNYSYHGYYGIPGYAGDYDYQSDYPYRYQPTPEQRKTALQRIEAFFAAIFRHKRPAATQRYIAVETLKPTPNQLVAYKKERARAIATAQQKKTKLAAQWVPAENLRCVLVFDTKSHQFVGSDCYVVPELPSPGQVLKFDTVSAEFVGGGS